MFDWASASTFSGIKRILLVLNYSVQHHIFVTEGENRTLLPHGVASFPLSYLTFYLDDPV